MELENRLNVSLKVFFDTICRLLSQSRMLQVIVASQFLWAASTIKIPLFFSPVPLSGQTFAVMLIGALMGSRNGTLAVIFYFLQGSMGLPVFAGGGSGIHHLIGPTGGYLIGFIAQTMFIGVLFEKINRITCSKVLFILTLSAALQLSIGVLWLSSYVGITNSLIMGLYPFIIGELVKVFLVTHCIKYYEKISHLHR